MTDVVGREASVHLIAECSRRTPGDVRSKLFVHFCGQPGSGKSALLENLAGHLHESGVPHAQLDLAGNGDHDHEVVVQQLVGSLVFDLSRRFSHATELRFPRFLVAQVAMKTTLDDVDRAAARKQLVAELLAHRGVDRWMALFADIGGLALRLIPEGATVAAEPLTFLERYGVRALRRHHRVRQVLLGRALTWFASVDRPEKTVSQKDVDAIALDTLVMLGKDARQKDDEAAQRRVSVLLLRSLLADLGDLDLDPETGEMQFNPIVLLDNVDTPFGRRLLLRLAQAVQAARAFGGEIPLTVVTTGCRDISPLLGPTSGILLTGQDQLRENWSWPTQYLAPLAVEHVSTLATRVGSALGGTPADLVASMVFALTRGQPAATCVLLSRLPDTAQRLDLEQALTSASRGGVMEGGSTVEGELLHRLLPIESLEVLDKLIPLAAARTPSDAMALLMSTSLGSGTATRESLVQAGLWDERVPEEVTAIRRLLLRRLAAFASDASWSWTAAHETLITVTDTEDPSPQFPTSLYYSIGLGRFSDVAEKLAAGVDRTTDLASWYRQLRAIASAPRPTTVRPPGTTALAIADDLDAFCRGDPLADGSPRELVGALRKLLILLAVETDPFCGPRRRSLFREIAAQIEIVGRHVGARLDPAHELSRIYFEQAEQWGAWEAQLS